MLDLTDITFNFTVKYYKVMFLMVTICVIIGTIINVWNTVKGRSQKSVLDTSHLFIFH